MENPEKTELMDLTGAVLIIDSIIERFAGQQLLTNQEVKALSFSRNAHVKRREVLLKSFNIDEGPEPAVENDGKWPTVDQKEGSGNPWP